MDRSRIARQKKRLRAKSLGSRVGGLELRIEFFKFLSCSLNPIPIWGPPSELRACMGGLAEDWFRGQDKERGSAPVQGVRSRRYRHRAKRKSRGSILNPKP